jgi:hypothetical protein
MGFEIRLHVVAVTENDHDFYRLQVGMFDLCKPGYESEISKFHGCGAYNSVPVEMYEGEEKRDDDYYGDTLWAHPIQDVITALEKDAKGDDYWRFRTALDILKSIRDNWSWFGEPYVVTFGH